MPAVVMRRHMYTANSGVSFRFVQELPEFVERALEACTKRTSDEKRYESYLARRQAGHVCAAAGLMGTAAGGAAHGAGEETLDERMMPFQRDGVRCVVTACKYILGTYGFAFDVVGPVPFSWHCACRLAALSCSVRPWHAHVSLFCALAPFRHALRLGGRALIGDEMGLGKTVQVWTGLTSCREPNTARIVQWSSVQLDQQH